MRFVAQLFQGLTHSINSDIRTNPSLPECTTASIQIYRIQNRKQLFQVTSLPSYDLYCFLRILCLHPKLLQYLYWSPAWQVQWGVLNPNYVIEMHMEVIIIYNLILCTEHSLLCYSVNGKLSQFGHYCSLAYTSIKHEL